VRSPGPSRWLILAAFVAIGGALTAFESTRVTLIGPLWLAAVVLVAPFYARAIWKAKRLDRLRRVGVAAQARAHSVKETGLVIHEMPRLELELEVQGPSGGYAVTKRVVVPLSEVARLREGEPFPVKVDPGEGDRVAFEWQTGSDQRASWIARAGGGPATIDAAALAKEKETVADEGGPPLDRSL
jgi:hypothetical protein